MAEFGDEAVDWVKPSTASHLVHGALCGCVCKNIRL